MFVSSAGFSLTELQPKQYKFQSPIRKKVAPCIAFWVDGPVIQTIRESRSNEVKIMGFFEIFGGIWGSVNLPRLQCVAPSFCISQIERGKTKVNIMTLTNHKEHRLSCYTIKTCSWCEAWENDLV